jgi:hypothetical protein
MNFFYDYFISILFIIFLIFLITKIYKNNSLDNFTSTGSSDIINPTSTGLNIDMEITPLSLSNVIAYYPSNNTNIIYNNNNIVNSWIDSIGYKNHMNLTISSNDLIIDNTHQYPMINFINPSSFIKSSQPTEIIEQITGFMAIVNVRSLDRYNYLFSPLDERENLSFRSFGYGDNIGGDGNNDDLQSYGYVYYNGNCVYDSDPNSGRSISKVILNNQDVYIVYVNFKNLTKTNLPYKLLDSSQNPTTNSHIVLGTQNRSRGILGLIGDLILFNNYHTTQDQIYMEGFLAKKWGLSNKLNVDHLFYNVITPTRSL